MKIEAIKEKIMRRSTLWKKIKELENQGLSVHALGYLKSKEGKIYAYGTIPEEATGIPSLCRPTFYVRGHEEFEIHTIDKYIFPISLPAAEIRVKGKTVSEAREKLQKILEKYKF